MRIKLNLDSIALLLFCSDLIITDAAPLDNEEWYEVEKKLKLSDLKRPARLFGINEFNLRLQLDIDENLALKMIERVKLYDDLLYSLYNLENENINITTIYEEDFPSILNYSLKKECPLYLYYSGDLIMMNNMFSIMGIHKSERKLQITTRHILKKMINEDKVLISSDNEGIENYALKTYLSLGGKVICFVSDHMIDKKETYKKYIKEGRMLLVSVIDPYAFFNVTHAIDRNMYISCLSDYAILIACYYNSGETWLSAYLSLNNKWTDLLVVENVNYDGNMKLLTMGANLLSNKDIKSEISIESLLESKNKKEVIEDEEDYQLSIYDFLKE